jgi:quinoprotein glucose dehydrogenase
MIINKKQIFILLSYFGFILITGCQFDESYKKKIFRDWPLYSGDQGGSKYTGLDQINLKNVQSLELAWVYGCGDMQEYPATTIQCNPIIVDGIMYLTTPGLKLVALDAVKGEELWRFDPYEGKSARGVNRGVTYWTDGITRQLFYVADSYLYCIDADSGSLLKTFGDGGRTDLRRGLGRDMLSMRVTANTPGVIYQDLLILGSAVGEGPSPAAPGHIRAYDVRTGEIRWTFHTIPHPGEYGNDTWWPLDAWERVGGANSWGGFTLDEKRGIVFCGTGSASYDHWGGDRVGQNLFANCILALNAATGQRIWHYQVVHHDIWDYDIPCPPNLVQVSKNGRIIDAVAQPTKMGNLFILDRETGTPLFPVEEIPVPPSDIPGEQTWPTQPFPALSLRYAQQNFTEAEITDISEEAADYVRKKLNGMRTGSIFLPPGFQPSVVLPQFNGGTNWGGAAYDPKSRILYVNTSNEAEWISMVPANPDGRISKYQLGRRLFGASCTSCHSFENLANPNFSTIDNLKNVAKERERSELHNVLLNGKGQMPGFAMLSVVEREALVSYLKEEGQTVMLEREQLELSFAESIPFVSTGHNVFRDHEGFPANKRPWGTLTAINLDKGAIIWQSTLGTYPQLEARGFEATGTFNMGGPLVTAGGLVFIGATMDERFRAFDKQTGEVLWEYQLNAGGYATPSTYEVAGKQYIVIAAGGGGKPETRPGDNYYCFTLKKK